MYRSYQIVANIIICSIMKARGLRAVLIECYAMSIQEFDFNIQQARKRTRLMRGTPATLTVDIKRLLVTPVSVPSPSADEMSHCFA